MSEAREQPAAAPVEDTRPPPGLANGAEVPDDEPEAAGREYTVSDLRTALAGGDEKRAKQLERYATNEAIGKAFFDMRERIRTGRAEALDPPEEATDVELAAWRKQAGIPESPEGYGVELGKDASENDKADLASFAKFAHSKGLTPKAVKAATEWWQTQRAARREQAAAAAEIATDESLQQARQHFPGREWKRMFGSPTDKVATGLANEFLNDHFKGGEAQQALNDFLDTRLPNGVLVRYDVHWLKAIASMARAASSEDDLVAGDVGGGARSVDEEFNELAAKPKLTQRERDRMVQLAEAREKREARMAAR